MAGGGVPIYTEICVELCAAIAAASSTPGIQVHLILSLLGKYLLRVILLTPWGRCSVLLRNSLGETVSRGTAEAIPKSIGEYRNLDSLWDGIDLTDFGHTSPYPVLICLINHCQTLRRKNRQAAERDIARANFEWLEFDRMSQQGTNDAASIRERVKILSSFLGFTSDLS